MKHLTTYINESVYELPEEFYKESRDILKGICNKLKSATSKSKLSAPDPETDTYWGSKKDQAKYIGTYREKIFYNFYNHAVKDIELFKNVWNIVFEDQPVEESLFDNDLIKKGVGEEVYKFLCAIRDCLCEVFKIRNLSGLKKIWDKDVAFAKAIKELPTIKEGNIYTTLTNVSCRFYGVQDQFPNIEFNFEQYIEKDPEKVATIKQEIANLKPLDCMGREIQVGDTVAYAPTKRPGTRFSSVSKSLTSGVVTAASKQLVTVDTTKLYADGCCIVARKGGKMIE